MFSPKIRCAGARLDRLDTLDHEVRLIPLAAALAARGSGVALLRASKVFCVPSPLLVMSANDRPSSRR